MIIDLDDIILGCQWTFPVKTKTDISNFTFELRLRKNYNDTESALIKTVTNGTITPDSDGYYNSLPIYIHDDDYDNLYIGDWYITFVAYDVSNALIPLVDSYVIKILRS